MKRKAWCHLCKADKRPIMKLDAFLERYERRCPDCGVLILWTPFFTPDLLISKIERQLRDHYRKYTLKDLKLMCRDFGKKGYSRASKSNIIDILMRDQYIRELKKHVRPVCDECIREPATCGYVEHLEFPIEKTVREAIGELTPIDCKRFIHRDEDHVMENEL